MLSFRQRYYKKYKGKVEQYRHRFSEHDTVSYPFIGQFSHFRSNSATMSPDFTYGTVSPVPARENFIGFRASLV